MRWVAKALAITERQEVQELGKSFPFGLLESLLLIVVFYSIVNLYHRALYILRNYRYLAGLEREIREELGSPDGSIAFTRERAFYWGDRASLQTAVKWFYIVLVGCLLFAFLGGRIWQDIKGHNSALAVVDSVISLATSLFFFAYARSSVSMDSAKTVVGLAKSTEAKPTARK